MPIKDKEVSSKLDSSMHRAKPVSAASRDNHAQAFGEPSQNSNKSKQNEASDKLKKHPTDIQSSNRQPNANKDQSSKPSLFSKSSVASAANNNGKQTAPSKTYSSNVDQSSKSGNRKEVYDFDDADEEIEVQTKFGAKLKKNEQV